MHFAMHISLIAKKVLDDIRLETTDEKTVVGITTMQGESRLRTSRRIIQSHTPPSLMV